jgi:hypothetical protein
MRYIQAGDIRSPAFLFLWEQRRLVAGSRLTLQRFNTLQHLDQHQHHQRRHWIRVRRLDAGLNIDPREFEEVIKSPLILLPQRGAKVMLARLGSS